MNLATFLHVTLLPVEGVIGASDVPTLRATVQNRATHQITVLTYNGLLDKAAKALGIIHVIDNSTGKELPSDPIQFRRVWPPPRDAFVEIAPHDSVEVHIPLTAHKLDAGKEYEVVAKWAWQGLWEGGVDTAMEACSKAESTEGLREGLVNQVKMEGTFVVKEM